MKLNKRSNIIIRRLGAKDNDIKFFIDYLPDTKYIIEAFGGSYALCRRVYDDDKYIKIVNDNDSVLYSLYSNIDEYLIYYKEMHDLINPLLLQNEKTANIRKIISSANLNNHDKYFSYFFCANSAHGMFKKTPTGNTDFNYNLIKKINFHNKDFREIIEEYKNNSEAFIFLDPPYLFSFNKAYEAQDNQGDMTTIIIDILGYLKDKTIKAKIMLIINKMNILEYIFKDFIKGTYKKSYSLTRRKDEHLIITNYDVEKGK